MRLLIDEMWPAAIAVQLRQRGHDVTAVQERPALRGQPDATIFAIAQEEGRAVLTENFVDYRPLAAERIAQGQSHSGLIFTTDRRFPRRDPRTFGRLVTALAALLPGQPVLTNAEHWLQSAGE